MTKTETMTSAKPWYETAFQADYIKRYQHRNDKEARQAVDLILDLVPLNKSHLVLDLCCGAGRHSLAFCQAGYQVIGLDLSMDLLKQASSQPCDHVMGYVRGDMRKLPFEKDSFFSIVHLFTAFGYFDDDQENESVFSEIQRILEPGGYYFFDFLNAQKVIEQIGSEPLISVDESELDTVQSVKKLSDDQKRVIKTIAISDEEASEPMIIEENVRLFHQDDLRKMFERNGLKLVNEFGGYAGENFKPDLSERYMALLQK